MFLYVRDLEQAARWYEDALGLSFRVFGDWAEARLASGQRFGLHRATHGDPQTPGTAIVDLRTAGLDAARSRLSAKGVACGDVVETPSGRFFAFTDVEGYRVQLFEPAR